jgi:hypothetical protein
MGLRDRLTGLREQAQEAVAEHKEEIQNAMETAGAIGTGKRMASTPTRSPSTGRRQPTRSRASAADQPASTRTRRRAGTGILRPRSLADGR